MAQSNRSTAMARGSNAGLLCEFADLFASLTNLFDGYRPERHYMRGPGPAWHCRARCLGGTAGDASPEPDAAADSVGGHRTIHGSNLDAPPMTGHAANVCVGFR